MGSKTDYFIESAEWVAGHGDTLVRQGFDALEGMFLVFTRNAGETSWRRTNHDPFADLAEAVEAASKIPSSDEQGRAFAQYVKDVWGGPPSERLVGLLDRLIKFDEDHPEELS